jgi:hypothetical protein
VALLAAPPGMRGTLGDLPKGVRVETALRGKDAFDVVLWFTKERSELEKRFAVLASRLDPAGGLWICWPKRASKVPTDVTEDVVRGVALSHGLVDVKVCAVDAVWSGLRCVVRLENRPPR